MSGQVLQTCLGPPLSQPALISLRDTLRRYDFMNGPDFLNQLLILIESEGLRAIRQSFLGLIVNFDDQAIGAHCHSCARQRNDHIVFACAM